MEVPGQVVVHMNRIKWPKPVIIWILDWLNLSYLVRLHPDLAKAIHSRARDSSQCSLFSVAHLRDQDKMNVFVFLRPDHLLNHKFPLSTRHCWSYAWWLNPDWYGNFAVVSVCSNQTSVYFCVGVLSYGYSVILGHPKHGSFSSSVVSPGVVPAYIWACHEIWWLLPYSEIRASVTHYNQRMLFHCKAR